MRIGIDIDDTLITGNIGDFLEYLEEKGIAFCSDTMRITGCWHQAMGLPRESDEITKLYDKYMREGRKPVPGRIHGAEEALRVIVEHHEVCLVTSRSPATAKEALVHLKRLYPKIHWASIYLHACAGKLKTDVFVRHQLEVMIDDNTAEIRAVLARAPHTKVYQVPSRITSLVMHERAHVTSATRAMIKENSPLPDEILFNAFWQEVTATIQTTLST